MAAVTGFPVWRGAAVHVEHPRLAVIENTLHYVHLLVEARHSTEFSIVL